MIRNKNYPYELCDIINKDYSHCIVDYNDEIIAYQDKKTKEWHTTDYWIEHRPDTMEVSFSFGSSSRTINLESLKELVPEDELFMELL